ncbi:MAG TPA: IS1380 family transposase, partial [Bacteroidales bacterium]|nr:IS1380 family transposase [Bacteroidales bacterium]
DPLVQHLLSLKEDIDQDTLTGRLKALGQRGSFSLQEGLFRVTGKMQKKSNLSYITIDCDSTVATVYGNQEGAAKGYNPYKLGANSYHSQLCFCTEMKLILNSWFRTGSAYTSNGICEFMKQTLASLPRRIRRIFFRADSGYFNGALFDLLENEGHDYLVKVKLKNLSRLMLEQKWSSINEKESVCEFEYQAKDWKKARTLRGIRILTGYKQTNFFGKISFEPEYEYFCYCSNLNDKDGEALHELYKKRAESENWIEQTKNQLHASQTLTDDFSTNDILWQLSVLGYNLSVMMRYEANSKIWRQEHLTFFRWFINVPGKVVKTARKVTVKMSRHYWYADQWRDFEQRLSIAC